MSVRVIIGDALEQLRLLPDESVNCCVTSPPYYGLRDYGTAQWDGGDDGCRHLMPATGASQNKGNNGKFGAPYRDECGHCGARRIDRQIGLEASPDEYIATLVEVFREVRRVLRADGTLWLNIGDSYAG
jgi:site-specific DNA-methyltransferase (cytosine-N4-specific)